MTISILSIYDIYIRHICAVPQVPVAAYFSAAPPSLSSATVATAKAAHFISAWSRWGTAAGFNESTSDLPSLKLTNCIWKNGFPMHPRLGFMLGGMESKVGRLWIVMEGDTYLPETTRLVAPENGWERFRCQFSGVLVMLVSGKIQLWWLPSSGPKANLQHLWWLVSGHIKLFTQ